MVNQRRAPLKKAEWVHRAGGIPTPGELLAYRSVGKRRCLVTRRLRAKQ